MHACVHVWVCLGLCRLFLPSYVFALTGALPLIITAVGFFQPETPVTDNPEKVTACSRES